METLLKKETSEHELKIYDLYIQRIMKEYDHIWGRFKIYFAFNTGVFIAMGFFLAPIVYAEAFPFLPSTSWLILTILSVLGLVFSNKWKGANLDSKRWMLFMNNVLKKIEESVFVNLDLALYYGTQEEYEKGSESDPKKKDVIDINIEVSDIFRIVFIILIVITIGFFCGALINSVL